MTELGECSYGTFVCVVWDFQILIAGVLAIVAAGITAWAIRSSTKKQLLAMSKQSDKAHVTAMQAAYAVKEGMR
jgi:hypothetical protein